MRARVREVMKAPNTLVSPENLVTRARSIMRISGSMSLPVVDAGKLEGIITARQVLRITSTRSNIPVKGLMLKPVLVATPDEPLKKFVEQMLELDLSTIPVIKSSSNLTLLGTVDIEDILTLILPTIPPELKVEAIMRRRVDVCRPGDSIKSIWDLMEETGYSGLPVVRKERRGRGLEVIGVITRSNIIQSGSARIAEESEKGPHVRSRVEHLMKTPATTVGINSSLKKGVEVMIKKGIGSLPVLDGKKLVGIITRNDLIKNCMGG
jgi:CBS domain-containing protein